MLFHGVLEVSLLVLVSAVLSLPERSDGDLYIAPTSVKGSWKVLTPDGIDCRASVGKRGFDRLIGPREWVTWKWTKYMTIPASGFSCVGIKRSTRCSRSMFGYDSISRESKRYLPSPSLCMDQYQKYREGHPLDTTHPYPECHWMGENVVESNALSIILNSVDYNAFASKYSDHLLADGECRSSPCITADRLSYWFNTSDPGSYCHLDSKATVYFTTDQQDKLSNDIEFISIDLQATSFRGSCKMSYCNTTGLLLNTHEWVALNPAAFKTFPHLSKIFDCYSTNTSWQAENPKSIVTHVMAEFQYDRQYEQCIKVQETIMLGGNITRLDLQYLVPMSTGTWPVYRYFNNTLEVNTAEYETIIAPPDNAGSHRGASLGLSLNRAKVIMWENPFRSSEDIIDGPNGMFWYRGRLMRPGKDKSRLVSVMDHMSKSLVTYHVNQGEHVYNKHINHFSGDGIEYTSPWMIRNIAHMTVLESIGVLICIALVIFVIVKIILYKIKNNSSGTSRSVVSYKPANGIWY